MDPNYQSNIAFAEVASYPLEARTGDEWYASVIDDYAIEAIHPPELDASYYYVLQNIMLYQEFIDLRMSHRNYHVEEYAQGDTCAVDGKKRRIKIFYYCDSYAAYQSTYNEDVDHNGINQEER